MLLKHWNIIIENVQALDRRKLNFTVRNHIAQDYKPVIKKGIPIVGFLEAT